MSKTKKSRRKSPKADSTPIRTAIQNAMTEQGYTAYSFHKALEAKVSRTAVYRYLNDGASTSVETVEYMMNLLGLKVVGKK